MKQNLKAYLQGLPFLYKNEEGVVFVISLLLLFAMSLLMVVAVMSTTTETKIAANYKNSLKAFYDAEAGVQYALYAIESNLANGSLTLSDPNTQTVLSYSVPAGFSFQIAPIKQFGPELFNFLSTGRSGNSMCVIEVGFRRQKVLGTLFRYGIFGNNSVDFKLDAFCLGYDSDVNPYEVDRANSIGGCNVGTNVAIWGRNKIYINGDVELGDNGLGWEGVFIPLGDPGPTVTGFCGRDVPRVNPDPMDVANLIAKYASPADNDNATNSAIVNNEIKTKEGDHIILTTGDYYLTDVDLKNNVILDVDASLGPVNIYLHGPMIAKLGSKINWIGKPTDFNIFCDTTDNLEFRHLGHCNGIVYAPFSSVLMYNSANVHGVIWGYDVEMKNGGDFWFDVAIANRHTALVPTSDVSLVSWRQVID